MCIYIHPCLTLENKGRLRVLYISAWAFCVVRSWWYGIAKALKHGTDEGERFPRLFYIFLSTIDWIVRPTGVWGTHISRIGTWFMRDNLLNARFTNRDAPSPGSLPNYAAHAPMFTRYSGKRISTSTCSGASPASSTTTSSTIYPTASVRAAPPVYPNRIQFRILLGTMFSPAGIVLSHTFASILTYNHKGIWKRKNWF